jgi:hypothetical protein
MQRKKTEVRSFSLDSELLRNLKVAARREGVSENAFVEGLLSDRVRIDPVYHAVQSIVLDKQTFSSVLGMTHSEGLDIVGYNLGKSGYTLARELYQSNGVELGFVEYITWVLQKAGWFEIEGAEVRPERITLHHAFGPKWSGFVKSYLEGAYEVVSRERLQMEAAESYVTVNFSRPQASIVG